MSPIGFRTQLLGSGSKRLLYTRDTLRANPQICVEQNFAMRRLGRTGKAKMKEEWAPITIHLLGRDSVRSSTFEYSHSDFNLSGITARKNIRYLRIMWNTYLLRDIHVKNLSLGQSRLAG